MQARHVTDVLLAFALISGLAMSGTASAQSAEAIQVLDTVAIFGPGNVVKADFDTGGTDPGVSVAAGETVRACQLTAGSGLFCLVSGSGGIDVVNWSNAASNSSRKKLFACSDIADLDSKSADVCTGVTVSLDGAIWVAGKNKGRTHNLVKVVKASSKPAGAWTQVGTTDYYWKNWATGRPLLVDITSIDGEEAAKFALGAGVLGLQERKIVVFFPADPTQPAIEIASGKTGWGLQPKEQLQGVTFEAVDGPNDLVYVTTSKGRILAKNISDSLVPDPVASVPGSVAQPPTDGCTLSSPQFGIRRSGKSGLVYVTNRDCKKLYAFNPAAGGWSVDGEPITTTEGPEGPTVAPGIGVNLADCGVGKTCEPVQGFEMSSVDLSSTESGLTLFQVKGIPDCRYIPETCKTLLGRDNLDGVVIDPNSIGDAAAQYLNVTPLLPVEITSLYEASGGLPDLLISPQYRAQEDNSNYFEAFFGKTEENVSFNGVFESEFFVAELTQQGRENGCLDSTTDTPAGDFDDLIRWDIVTRVSEKYASTGAGDHIDTLVNTGCGSSKGTFGGWSLVAYNLEPTRDTYVPELGRVVPGNDAVFARLLRTLYGELGVVTSELACTTYDVPTIKNANGEDVPNPNAPISPNICATLKSDWANSWDKLDKCLNATYQPKTSSGNQNCQSFLSQFKSYNDTLAIVGPYGLDPANRKGELAARSKVIEYVYHERFVPSVPDGGFCEETDPDNCPRN